MYTNVAYCIDKVSQEHESALQSCFVFIYFEKFGYEMLAGKEKSTEQYENYCSLLHS